MTERPKGRQFSLEEVQKVSENPEELRRLVKEGIIRTPYENPTIADLLISFWDIAIPKEARAAKKEEVEAAFSRAMWKSVDYDLKRLDVVSAGNAVGSGLRHTLNNAITGPIGFIDFNRGPKDFKKAFAIFTIESGQKPTEDLLEEKADDKIICAQKKASRWQTDLTDRIRTFLEKIKYFDKDMDTFLQWQEFVKQELKELSESGIPQDDVGIIDSEIRRVGNIWQSLTALANEGRIPPIIQHPAGAGKEDLMFDFAVLPKEKIPS